MSSLDDLFKYHYTENTGWEGVWARQYSRIQKLPLEQKPRLQRRMLKKFGVNMKRTFAENLMKKDYALKKVAKNPWRGGPIMVPFELRDPGEPVPITGINYLYNYHRYNATFTSIDGGSPLRGETTSLFYCEPWWKKLLVWLGLKKRKHAKFTSPTDEHFGYLNAEHPGNCNWSRPEAGPCNCGVGE